MLQLTLQVSSRLISPPDKYEGEHDELGFKTKVGNYVWDRPYFQSYEGSFFRGTLHNEGCYRRDQQLVYEGFFFANKKEGYGLASYPNGSTYEGLYKDDKRFGPGVYTYSDGKQDVGLWYCNRLLRICYEIPTIPKLATTRRGKRFLNCYKKTIEVDGPIKDIAKEILSGMNARSLLLDQSSNLFAYEVADVRTPTFDHKSFLMNLLGEQVETLEPLKLIVWNDSDLMIEMMKYTYKYKVFEPMLSFCVVCVLKNERSIFKEPGIKEIASNVMLGACSTSETNTVKYTFEEYDLYPDVEDCCGNTGVMFASCIYNLDIINFLLDQGADVNHTNDEGSTAFSICAIRYFAISMNIKNLEALIPRSISPRNAAKEWWGYFGSHKHMKCKISDVIPDMNEIPQAFPECIFSSIDEPPLKKKRSSSRRGRKAKFSGKLMKEMALIIDTLKLLVRRGANPDKCTIPRSGLFLAIYCRDVEFVSLLLEFGSNPNIKSDSTDNYLTPLALACKMEGADMVQIASLLLEYRADPNRRCGLAHDKSRRRAVLGDRPFPEVIQDDGIAPIHIICMKPLLNQSDEVLMKEMLKVLLRFSADIDLTYLSYTPLTLAILMRNKPIVDELLDNGVDPNYWSDDYLGPPLAVLIAEECKELSSNFTRATEIMNELLEYGADPLVRLTMEDNEKGTIVDFVQEKWKNQSNKKGTKQADSVDGKKLLEILKKVMRECATRGVQGNLVKALLQTIRQPDSESIEVDVEEARKWLTQADIVRCTQLFRDNNFEVSPEEEEELEKLLELEEEEEEEDEKLSEQLETVSNHSPPKLQDTITRSVTSDDNLSVHVIEKVRATLSQIVESLKRRPRELIVPELDENSERYEMCYVCLRQLLNLRRCPICGLVYLCDDHYMKSTRAAANESLHKCFDEEDEGVRTKKKGPLQFGRGGDVYGIGDDFLSSGIYLGTLKSPYTVYRDGDLYYLLRLLVIMDENYSYN